MKHSKGCSSCTSLVNYFQNISSEKYCKFGIFEILRILILMIFCRGSHNQGPHGSEILPLYKLKRWSVCDNNGATHSKPPKIQVQSCSTLRQLAESVLTNGDVLDLLIEVRFLRSRITGIKASQIRHLFHKSQCWIGWLMPLNDEHATKLKKYNCY